jgi:cytosine/adenosine deaminase-related metal-dependent hydrolase
MDSPVILRGARVALGPSETAELDIEIGRGKIQAMRKGIKARKGVVSVELGGYLILPGLINSHDHLEFNLYPRLGSGPYANAGCWARDVYRPHESPVREQLAIPKATRMIWGGLKNLLSGVTTVCHHNPRELAVFDRKFPVRVVKQFGWAHSLEFSADVAERFQETPAGWPFVIHLGEGSDRAARAEIFRLEELGALDARTVLVHALALDRPGLRLMKQKRASIVWCPSSNLFLFGRTLSAAALLSGIPIALGSDSAVSASGDLIDEIKLARRVSGLPSRAIYDMVTVQAARILRLRRGAGSLAAGCAADLIAVRERRLSPQSTLAAGAVPSLVIVGGKVKLVTPALSRRLSAGGLHRLCVEGRGEFLVDADVPRLCERASRAIGGEIHLAGRRAVA